MGGGADTGSGFTGILKKFCLTGTSSMMAEVRASPPARAERERGKANETCH